MTDVTNVIVWLHSGLPQNAVCDRENVRVILIEEDVDPGAETIEINGNPVEVYDGFEVWDDAPVEVASIISQIDNHRAKEKLKDNTKKFLELIDDVEGLVQLAYGDGKDEEDRQPRADWFKRLDDLKTELEGQAIPIPDKVGWVCPKCHHTYEAYLNNPPASGQCGLCDDEDAMEASNVS